MFSREYDPELDGHLAKVTVVMRKDGENFLEKRSCIWQAEKSSLFFWHDETEQLSSSFERYEDAEHDLEEYVKHCL
jgi:hypothetical protein